MYWQYITVIIVIIINMLIVQYPMQYCGPPRNISKNPCTAPLCAGEWWFN